MEVFVHSVNQRLSLGMSIPVISQNNWNYVNDWIANHLNGTNNRLYTSLIHPFLHARFMEHVAYDLPQYYPPIPLPPYATGEV